MLSRAADGPGDQERLTTGDRQGPQLNHRLQEPEVWAVPMAGKGQVAKAVPQVGSGSGVGVVGRV